MVVERRVVPRTHQYKKFRPYKERRAAFEKASLKKSTTKEEQKVAKKPKPATTKPKIGLLIKSRAALARSKAIKARNAILKTSKKVHKKKIRTSVSFRRPHTLRLRRNPAYLRHIVPVVSKNDIFSVLKHPLTTELCVSKLENSNTLTFIVSSRATKHSIRDAVKKRYEVKAARVTTLNLPNGKKKAYVKLSPDVDAIEIANKIGIF